MNRAACHGGLLAFLTPGLPIKAFAAAAVNHRLPPVAPRVIKPQDDLDPQTRQAVARCLLEVTN